MTLASVSANKSPNKLGGGAETEKDPKFYIENYYFLGTILFKLTDELQ